MLIMESSTSNQQQKLPTSQQQSKKLITFVIKSSSYVQVAQKDIVPKRDQALVLDYVDGLNLTDYTTAIGDIVEPKNVLTTSRISNNRVCIYLSSKNLVNDLTDKYEFISIANQNVTIRPLRTRNKRVIFSNVL